MGEKKTEETSTEEQKTVGKAEPVISRSMTEEACPACAAEEPAMPANLPDPSWSTERLIAATKDKHMLVRSNAIILLSRREASEAIEALIEALKDEEYLVKSNAMVAIATYGRAVADRVIQALSDADKDVRAGAAWVAGELKDSRAIEALERVAHDDYPLARIQAKASLTAMGRGPKRAKKEEAGGEERAQVDADSGEKEAE
ncbi:MAG TPA: HEAT repeat domain-containing protein [Methanothrix sp.]|nr:HEAT repeat domain-containing protein [Methanothrix sp.]HPC89031.1 HEAT repeat domain-containing protein [Methanothrix sp.]HQE86994.1 HEAT repeat domain-containing protein [Methanothrix sp.]HQI67869.1 HEAT repeat domain-containing protein [Methanothrix sp.]HRS84359.1 HEAT repeat domain-containing protein [Methanothrix sp.]